MADDRFFISTGDIRERYEPVNIVIGVSDVVFKNDIEAPMRKAIALLAQRAQKIDCNGVLWIRFEYVRNETGNDHIMASGTAVKVTVTDPSEPGTTV
jgi:uncharacterized protein YbjQ (UPF0145 family)